jgi:hypothetical protein
MEIRNFGKYCGESGYAGTGETPLRTGTSALPEAPCRERGHLARNGRPARSFPIPLIEELPDLEMEDIKAALTYAARRLDHPVMVA